MKSRLVVAALVLPLLALAPVAAQASSGHHGQSKSAQSKSAQNKSGQSDSKKGTSDTKGKKGKDDGPAYHVAAGPTFSSPLDKSRSAIQLKILRAINHTHRGQKIRMVSWNFDSPRYVGALTAAHRRGVSVRIIMARTLADAQGPRGPYNILRNNLAGSGNADRPAPMRSWFHTCSHSCRGKGGSMHAKYYIFSRTGGSRHVVMNTSANLTGASANVQWNELMTLVDRDKTYAAYMKVFNQATHDRIYPAYLYHDGSITGWFYPRPGRSDLVMDQLNQVKCSGADIAGQHGHTKVRVAQDVFNNTRGLTIAKKLLALHRHGCDVKVVYSQAATKDLKAVIAQLPNNHLVQDRDGDGAYDRYLHAKLLAISGHMGKNPRAFVFMDGSANYSATALQSDEQGMIFYNRPYQEREYSAFIDKMFSIHLVSATPNSSSDDGTDGRRVVSHVNPYRNMEG